MGLSKKQEPASVLSMVVAFVLVILGIKVGKVAFAFFEMNTLRALYASRLLRFMVLLGAAYGLSRLPLSRKKRGVIVLALVAVALLKLALLIHSGRADTPRAWLSEIWSDASIALHVVYSVLRQDVLFLSAFIIVEFALVKLVSARFQKVVRGASASFMVIVLLISSLELAHYIKSGIAGTGQLLGFFLNNAGALAPMLRSQLDLGTFAALVLPLLVWVVLSRMRFERLSDALSGSSRRLFPVAFLIAALVHLAPIDHRYDRFMGDIFMALGDLAPWHNNNETTAIRQAARMPLIFDTSHLTVRTTKDTPPKKNIVIIMLESTRASATSVYNKALDDTPFLVEFAKRGATVSEMFAPVPRTSAAWVSTIDGVYPAGDEEMSAWLDGGRRNLTSLPMALAPLGYTSAFFTSAHVNFMYDAALVHSMGFQTVADGDALPANGFEKSSWVGFEDRIWVQPSLSWVKEQRDHDKPFVLMIMTSIGHFNYDVPSHWPIRSFPTTDESYNRYLNCLSYVDSVVRELVNGLEKLDVLSNSIVLIMGDHGESFGEHGPRVHSLVLYNETLRIPTLLYAEGSIAPGSTITGLRQEIDVMPTMFDLLELTPSNATLPGTSFMKPVAADRSIYFAGAEGSQFLALRKGDTKFIYNFERTPTEAYAMNRDPYERQDIAETLSATTVASAESEMLLWRARSSLALNGRPSAGSGH